MANKSKPLGLKPVGHTNGSEWNGMVVKYFIPASDANDMYVGDLVKTANNANIYGTSQVVQLAAAGERARGVIVGIEYNPNTLERRYRKALSAQYCYVCESVDVVYEIQEDSVGGSLGITDVGKCGDIVYASGNPSACTSGTMLDSSSVSVANTAQLKLLSVVNRGDNEIGNYAKWRVVIYEHELNPISGSFIASGAAYSWTYQGSLADGGKVSMPVNTNGGWGFAKLGDGDQYAFFEFASNGTVTLLVTSDDVTSIEDNDTTFNIYDTGTAVGFNNELGSAKNLFVVAWYS